MRDEGENDQVPITETQIAAAPADEPANILVATEQQMQIDEVPQVAPTEEGKDDQAAQPNCELHCSWGRKIISFIF